MALPDYLQDTAKDYARQLTATTSAPIDTSKFTGRQFVAGEDPLQTAAINLATQGVIDETLRQFDVSRAGGLQQISDQAAGIGAFGGGRQGALQGQYMADTTAGRAGLAAQLLQSGFQDASMRRAQDLQNQFALSNFQRAGQAADVANLGQLGAFRQGLSQSQLQADMDAARTGAYEPYQRLSTYGTGITGLAGGVAGQQFQDPATPSPFSTALSTALGIGGLFGKFRS
jgi:hypothetical protein